MLAEDQDKPAVVAAAVVVVVVVVAAVAVGSKTLCRKISFHFDQHQQHALH